MSRFEVGESVSARSLQVTCRADRRLGAVVVRGEMSHSHRRVDARDGEIAADVAPAVRVWARRIVAVAVAAAAAGCALIPPTVPAPPRIERTVFLEQGWTRDEARWFHHVSQGTSTFNVPYTWLVALEQPRITLFEAPLLIEPEYMSRFGFIPSAAGPGNVDGLPVGFARDPNARNPFSGQPEDAAGFTCAACHTGRITYDGVAMVVEGAPAMTDLGKFRTTLGLAVAYTRYIPGRFGRFAQRVLGPSATEEQRDALFGLLTAFLDQARASVSEESARTEGSVEEGFGRLDAIGRIGNTVFGTELDARNIEPLTAPVAYPHIWDASWFDWVQYNGSIRQPMVRNGGEALGVTARVNLLGPASELYRSNVLVRNLADLETQLAGPAAWQGLRSPRWPEAVLGKIDRERAAKGALLYAELCQDCHMPPIDSPEMAEQRPPYFTAGDEFGRRYLRVRMIDLDYIGTDPRQAMTMHDRTVDLALLGSAGRTAEPEVAAAPSEPADFGRALAEVTESVISRWYEENTIPEAERMRMNGYRPNDVRAPLAYKARPLNGIWATPPYLHNGSVPDLYSLLLPVGERPRRFWLGSIELDPVRVGYVSKRIRGGFRIDTEELGSSNAGHEFADGTRRKGRIGRGLTEDERLALIEYLKTL